MIAALIANSMKSSSECGRKTLMPFFAAKMISASTAATDH